VGKKHNGKETGGRRGKGGGTGKTSKKGRGWSKGKNDGKLEQIPARHDRPRLFDRSLKSESLKQKVKERGSHEWEDEGEKLGEWDGGSLAEKVGVYFRTRKKALGGCLPSKIS